MSAPKMTKWGLAHQQRNGRWQVTLATQNGRRHYDYEHRLIYVEAYGPIPPGMIVHHRNGDMSDNRLENLELMTRGAHNSHHKRGACRTHRCAANGSVVKCCKACGKTKPLSCFNKNGVSRIGTPTHRPQCRACPRPCDA